jgi:hypothetical protein
MPDRTLAALVIALATASAPTLVGPAHAQAALTGNTLRLDPGAAPGHGTLADAAWMVGVWEGEGLGGAVQEAWAPAVADRMTGTFTSLEDGAVRFQEIMVLAEVDGSLELRVRHFAADFTAWEDRDDFVRFRLIRTAPDRLYFSGLTLERVGPDRMRAHLAMRSAGQLREETFEYRRVPGAGGGDPGHPEGQGPKV